MAKVGRFRRILQAIRGAEPAPRVIVRNIHHLPRLRSYDAAGKGHADTWLGNTSDAVGEVAGGLDQIRQRARDLDRNNPYAHRIIEALVNAVVSTGIRPTLDTDNKELADRVYDLWDRWGRVCVPGSRMNIYGLQRLACRSWFADGESLLRLRPRFVADMPGLPPLKLQPIEADLLDVNKTEQVGNSLNRIYSGIEFDAIGEVAAYHLYAEHPGAAWPFAGAAYDTVRVPAGSILHLFRADRPGQVRGVPILAPVTMALWDLAGYADAIRIGTRAAATLVASIKRDATDEDGAPGITSPLDSTGAREVNSDDTPIESLTPGMIVRLKEGEEMDVHAPDPPSGVADFVNACLHEIAAGAGLSYHVLSGDMSDSSFAQARLGLIEQAKNIDVLREQAFVPSFLDPLWRAFIDTAITASLLPPGEYPVRWSKPKQQSADRVEEAKAAMMEMRLGIRSRPEIIEADGRDPDDVNDEIAKDKAERDRLGIISDGDPSQTSSSGVWQADPSRDTSKTKPAPGQSE